MSPLDTNRSTLKPRKIATLSSFPATTADSLGPDASNYAESK
jgi:hypothetical protein